MRNDYNDYIAHKDHKYFAKTKANGKTRYFYTKAEYNAFINGRQAGIHQKPTRGLAGAAYTAKKKVTGALASIGSKKVTNAKNGPQAPASVFATHKVNNAKNAVSSAKMSLSKLTNELVNGRQAGIHQTPTRGLAGTAYTASRKTNDAMKSIEESYRKVAGDKNYGNGGLHPGAARKAIWNAKSKLGIAKTNAKKLYNNSVKPKAQKLWSKAGIEYHKDLKIAQHTANAIKDYATQKAGEAKMYAQHEMGRQKKAYNAKSKKIRHELSEIMNYHLNNNSDNWNEKFSKSLERKVVNAIANKNLSASERALWVKEAARVARQNGLKISAKRLAKLAATKF